MLCRHVPTILAPFFLLSALPLQAQEGALDIVPEDACLALVVRDLAELRSKGDAFFKEYKIPQDRAIFRPSNLDQAFWFLGIRNGVARKGTAAIILPNLEKLKVKSVGDEGLLTLVLAVPVGNANQMATNFGLKEGALKPGQYHVLPQSQLILGKPLLGTLKGRHVFIGARKDAINEVANGKPVTGSLSETQRQMLARADIAVHFGPQGLGKPWIDSVAGMEQRLRERDNPADAEVVKQFGEAMRNLQFVVGGLRIDERMGLALDVVASFNKGTGEGVPFLNTLRAGPGATDLNGLPEQDPLFVYAAKGDGTRNVAVARNLFRILFDEVPGLSDLLPAADRRQFLAAFDPMYQHLKGSRAAVYRTVDPQRTKEVGLLNGILILDLDDPDAHLSRWSEVVEVANRTAARADPQHPPKFAYIKDAEKLDGRRVDWLTIHQPGLTDNEKSGFRNLLGPEWNRLKMVVLDKGVVLLIGSDRDLLRKAVDNRLNGARGLAGNKLLTTACSSLSPERKLEFLTSLANVEAMARNPLKGVPVRGLSAIALTIEPDRLQLQARTPRADVPTILRQAGLLSAP